MPETPAPVGKIAKIFGVHTFDRRVMREKLPGAAYRSLLQTIESGKPMDPAIVPVVAHAMKEWALELGATHYCHWFQPMTGATAEKHDSFLQFEGDGVPIERFSEEQLVQGEPDASSFPSGGMRTTFEARGYTAWDPSSPAFLMEGARGRTLCIPSVFLSYNGEALDKKAPLLRSMEAVNCASVRMLRLLGRPVRRVVPQVGCEQEYFLVDRELYRRRPDLVVCGRTLLGARPPKGQQMEDHYFGSIPPRVLAFMQEAELELYKLGVPAKTRHNEVAPHQFEIAPIHRDVNLAADHNQLIMEVLRRVASNHGLALLLHEKPFEGINGSGKHNNWSLLDDEGHNLFEPGQTPHENLQFLVFLAAVLKAVHKRAALLRCSIASAGNDLRLGANEAPPAIISVFLGQQLSDILDRIERGLPHEEPEREILDLGISSIPTLSRHNTDRNRTSPFAFTGNKFEFRAVPSSFSISMPHTVLNVAMAEALDELAEEIESRRDAEESLEVAALGVLREEIGHTRPIRFEGDNYSEEWVEEARRRELPNVPTTPEALLAWVDAHNQRLLQRYGVLSDVEARSRYHIQLERYVNVVDIEAAMVLDLVHRYALPVCFQEQSRKADSISRTASLLQGEALELQKAHLAELSRDLTELLERSRTLERILEEVREEPNLEKQGERSAKELRPAAVAVREVADRLEGRVDQGSWPLPSYTDLLFHH